MTDPPDQAPRRETPTDGTLAVVQRGCATCSLIEPVLAQLHQDVDLTIVSQDAPDFPDGVGSVIDDRDLGLSYGLGIETVPTLLSFTDGRETDRVVGWDRQRWEAVTGASPLGTDLPGQRPGCGSLSVAPDRAEELAVRFRAHELASRRVTQSPLEDETEDLYNRGWTDGLPVVAPTEARVLRMLEGTARAADEIVAVVAPDLVDCTVEKVAVNAVMAGCLPDYLPVVLTAVEAAGTDEFNMHGLLATTYFAGPVVIVNGPIRRALGMNAGLNAFGQGNRANATIGRALQLVVRNVGGGRPGGVDRATMGNPGKYTFCFAEDEEGSPWEALSVERGLTDGTSAVTLYAGEGPRGIVDQLSRTPESLARSFAACLLSVAHPKLAVAFDAMLVVSPEHGRVFGDAGWSKARLREELDELLTRPGSELARGVDGIEEGLPATFTGADIPKFRPGGLHIVHAGGTAGLFSAIIGGWVAGATGSELVSKEVGP